MLSNYLSILGMLKSYENFVSGSNSTSKYSNNLFAGVTRFSSGCEGQTNNEYIDEYRWSLSRQFTPQIKYLFHLNISAILNLAVHPYSHYLSTIVIVWKAIHIQTIKMSHKRQMWFLFHLDIIYTNRVYCTARLNAELIQFLFFFWVWINIRSTFLKLVKIKYDEKC